MGHIFCLIGKSSSGKDTVYRNLLENKELSLRKVVLYTTRPIRNGEKDGQEYHFTDESGYQKIKASGKLIEERLYHTVKGMWRYFTVDDGGIDPACSDYLLIGTLESYEALRAYFGTETVKPIYISLDDGKRLLRAIQREQKQDIPEYNEMCRRFLADAEDFSEQKLGKAGIDRYFLNEDLGKCVNEIADYIKG